MNLSTSVNPQDFKAQNGEDRILSGEFADKKVGFCVEVGAFDGIDMSNSFFFERIGWKTLLVEADPNIADLCRRNRPGAIVVNCAAVPPGYPAYVSFQISEDVKGMSSLTLNDSNRLRITGYAGRLSIKEITIPARTLDSILEQSNSPSIDFISIDVEGHELGVLKGFDIKRWRPGVVLVERTGIFPVWKILRYFQKADYSCVRRTGDNDWFYPVAQSSGSAFKLILRFYLIPLPLLLPRAIARAVKISFYKLGLYQQLSRFIRK